MKTEQRKNEDRELLKQFGKQYINSDCIMGNFLPRFIKENDLEETKPFTIEQVAKGLEDLQKQIEVLKSKIN
jgi:hypothetical protein